MTKILPLILLLALVAALVQAENRPTCDCRTSECGSCSLLACTVKHDLSTSSHGITVSSRLRWKKYNSIVLYDEAGKRIGNFQWNLRGIYLSGCGACHTPSALRKARTRGGPTEWTFSLAGGVLQIAVGGEVLHSNQLSGECKEKYGAARRFAFSEMGCDSTFTFVEGEMELGARVTEDCSGTCSQQ